MIARCEVLDALNVARPLDLFWILRARHHEAAHRELARWLAQQFIHFGLTIDAVRTEVSQVPLRFELLGEIGRRISATQQWSRPFGSVARFEDLQCRTAGERQVEIEPRD